MTSFYPKGRFQIENGRENPIRKTRLQDELLAENTGLYAAVIRQHSVAVHNHQSSFYNLSRRRNHEEIW